MTASSDDREFRRRMDRIEPLLREVEQLPDPSVRARTQEIVQAILELHGAGLERMLGRIAEAGDVGRSLIGSLGRDDLVGSLLLLHGLHPLDIQTRVRQALDNVRPHLRSHGGNVELLGFAGGVVRLRLEGSGKDSSSAATTRLAIEEAIYAKAPDVTAIEVEDSTADAAQVGNGWARIALPILPG